MNNPFSPSKKALHTSLTLLFFIIVGSVAGCVPNNPYRGSEEGTSTYYSTFDEPPKHLDPARSYSSNEYDILGNIYEPLFQYNYLKRPYELETLTAVGVPSPVYYDKLGEKLPKDARPAEVSKAVYTIRIKKGIMYQPHPAFAKDPGGSALYRDLTEGDLKGVRDINDFPISSTRELTIDDYIFQIQRMADPRLQCPILPILGTYIEGLSEYSSLLAKDLEQIRKARKADAGATYSRELDERSRPIILEHDLRELPGIEKVDDYTMRITLKRKYPQFIYWLAMPFFSPMPEEAITFYGQALLKDKNITLDRYPIGTGPYRIGNYDPNMEIVLIKNENYHTETYPEEGEEGDLEAGLLRDAGKRLPLIDKLVFKLEKESIPRWNKFLQGYYDSSGISSDSFDQAVTLTGDDAAELTEYMIGKDISLVTSVRPSIYYLGFNMLDETIGSLDARGRKLRQAISIALDMEEFVEIFSNGRGVPAMGPLPPGIFGHLSGREGMNPFVYVWDEERERPERKSIKEARRLLKEAGYHGGRDKDGAPLIITFDNSWAGAESKPLISWYIKRLKLIGIQLENRTTDYNRFQEKMRSGNFQLFFWGWNADYPDPENFLFLLSGDNGKVKHQGENAANYSSPEFDRLFKEMENMDNSSERLGIIREAVRVLQRDSPWVWGYIPVSFGLSHSWVGNIKPNAMANNAMKYRSLDAELRAEKRGTWNTPRLWPIILVAIIFVALSLPALGSIRKRLGIRGRRND